MPHTSLQDPFDPQTSLEHSGCLGGQPTQDAQAVPDTPEHIIDRVVESTVVRDWSINKDVDAAHMLSPMPLSITLGAGSKQVPYFMPAVENINGQAITLHTKHKDVTSAKDMKGFRFCVPFRYSMHNYLLRYYLAEGGVHPDKDVQIRVVPPPEMVANLKADNVDGYLAPDPRLTSGRCTRMSDLFTCCQKRFGIGTRAAPSPSLKSLRQPIRIHFWPCSSRLLTRPILPRNPKRHCQGYRAEELSQSATIVLEQVLTGKFADGLGNIKNVPDRIDFDPFPWHSMAVWILTQMKRWKHVESDFDYAKVAEEVYLAAECDKISRELGYADHPQTYTTHVLMGKTFDPSKPDEYVKSFPINNLA